MLELFGDNYSKVCTLGRWCSSKIKRNCNILLTSPHELLVELAATIDAGEPFIKATCKLEGDGTLALQCYEILSSVRAAVQVFHLPNTVAVAKRVASPIRSEQHWMDYAKSCIKPGYDYFYSNLILLPVVDAFKAARLLNPAKINDLKLDGSTVETLHAFKFLDNDRAINELSSELPLYLVLYEDLSDAVDALDWWERNSAKLLFWSRACKQVLLCQPSSASVERVFSLLNHLYQQQQSALEDYVDGSCSDGSV